MTKRDVLSLALKISGVYSVIFAVHQIPSVTLWLSMMVSPARSSSSPIALFFSTVAGIFLILVAAYILLRWGDSIARILIKEDKNIPTFGSMDWERLFFILSLRIAGVICLIRGLPQLSNTFIRLRPMKEAQGSMSPGNWGSLISVIVLLILGVYLLLGAEGFARFVLKEKKPKKGSSNCGKNENLL